MSCKPDGSIYVKERPVPENLTDKYIHIQWPVRCPHLLFIANNNIVLLPVCFTLFIKTNYKYRLTIELVCWIIYNKFILIVNLLWVVMRVILGLIILFMSSELYAASFTGRGTVNVIGINSYDIAGPDKSTYFTIDGFVDGGNCAKHGGMVTIRLSEGEGGNRQLSMIMAAQMAGKEVIANIDDTRTDGSSTCIVRYILLPK